MSGFRLNGWQRIGIVLSVVWMLVGALWAQHFLFNHIYESYSICMAAVTDSTFCHTTYKSGMATAREMRPGVTAIFALAPIPIAWFLIYAFVGIVRWIRRGFTSKA